MKYSIIIFLSFFLLGNSTAQNHWQVSIASGAISPAFLIDTPLGYLFEGRITYGFSDSLQLSISSGFHSWEEALGFGGNKFKTIPLLAGIKYSFPIGLFSPYFGGELGVHFITRSYTFESYEPSENFPGLYRLVSSKPETESVTKFAFRFSVGSILSIYDNLDIDLSIRYNSISYDFIYIYNPSHQRSSGKIDFYSFLVGINYKI